MAIIKSKCLTSIAHAVAAIHNNTNNNTIVGTSGNAVGSYNGVGSFYYGSSICSGLSFSENNGYSFCESYTPGDNQLTLAQRNNLNIVAIGTLDYDNRSTLCGKHVRVYYNGIAQDQDYVVWDKCASCGDTTLDFSIDALEQINPNACQDGLTNGLSWEILDTIGIQFVP
jgi:hypothetical protein